MIRKNLKRTKAPVKLEGKTGPKRIFTFAELDNVVLLSKLGATNREIAEYFRVGVGTVEKWSDTHPEFVEARKRGGVESDMKVVRALFLRAVGFDYEEKEYTNVKKQDPETGEISYEMRLTKVSKKHAMPDVKAAIKWLGIKRRDFWQDNLIRVDQHITHSGQIDHTHRRLEEVPINQLSPEAQDIVFEIVSNQIKAKEDE